MKLEIKANENDLSNVGCDILNHYIEYHRQKEDCFLRQCIMNSLDSKISKLLREKQKQLIWNAIGEKSYQEFMLLLASIPTIGKESWRCSVQKEFKAFANIFLNKCENGWLLKAKLSESDETTCVALTRQILFPAEAYGIFNMNNSMLRYGKNSQEQDAFLLDFTNIFVKKKMENILFSEYDFYDAFPGCYSFIDKFRVRDEDHYLYSELRYIIPLTLITEDVIKAAANNSSLLPTDLNKII